MKTVMLIFYLSLPIVIPLLGLAVKGMTSILMTGSLFEPMRRIIIEKSNSSKRKLSSFFWGKVKELFSCNLCLSAHVSFFLVIVPLFILFYFFLYLISDNYSWINLLLKNSHLKVNFAYEIIIDTYGSFLFSMTLGALAMGWYGILEYFPEKQKMEQEYLEKRISLIRIQNYNDRMSKRIFPKINDFTLEDFQDLLSVVYSKSLNIECNVTRYKIRLDTTSEMLKIWFENKKINDEELFGILLERIGNALKEYFAAKDYSPKRPLILYYEKVYQRE